MANPPKFSNYQEIIEWVVEVEMQALPSSEQVPLENAIDQDNKKNEVEVISEIEREIVFIGEQKSDVQFICEKGEVPFIDEKGENINIVEPVEIENVDPVIEQLSLSEEAWLNTLTDNLHLEECESSDEIGLDEEDPLMILRKVITDCYKKRVDLPSSASMEYGEVQKLYSGEREPKGVGSMAEVCEGLAEIFSTLKKLEETRAQIAMELSKKRVSRAKAFLNAVVSARYIISGLWPLQLEKNLSFRRLVKLMTVKSDTALKLPRELSRPLMTFTLTSIDELLPVIYML